MWNGNTAASVLPGHPRAGGFGHHVARPLPHRKVSLLLPRASSQKAHSCFLRGL